MRYSPNRLSMGQFLRGPEARRVCTIAAAERLTRARALCPRDTGQTAASGRLVHSSNGGVNGDRVQVAVRFDRAAAALQFGNRRTRASRFLTRAFEGGG